MSINLLGETSCQSTVEDQLKILGSINDKSVQQFVRETLDSWNGRQISKGELNSTIDKITHLVSKVLNSKKSISENGEIRLALEKLKKTKGETEIICTTFSSSTSKTVETILNELDEDHLDSHPAYRMGWTQMTASNALKLPSIPIGSYVIVKEKKKLTMFIKGDSGPEQHSLEKKEGEAGYTVFNPLSFFKSFEDSCSGEEDVTCFETNFSKKISIDKDEDTAPPAVLSMTVTPLRELKPETEALLKLCSQLSEVKFNFFFHWRSLKEKSDFIKAPNNRPQHKSSENHKKSSVDEINLAERTAKLLIRRDQPVFFHCNTIKVGKHQFDCHQLPTDYSRDDVWLSLWNDAGEADGRATIMKLSTNHCPLSNDLPVIRDYWPVRKGDPSIKKFQNRCLLAEKTLKRIEKKDKIEELIAKISRMEKEKAKTEIELNHLENELTEIDAAPQINKLKQNIKKYNEEIKKNKQELDILLIAAKEHLAYVLKEKEAEESGTGPGVYIGSLTTIDEITVEHIDETLIEDFPGAILRQFKLTQPGETPPRFVTQIDYPHWSDFSATNASVLTSLRDLYREVHGDNPAPMKVHCRAGVGRTGTFIVFCGAMDMIEDAVETGKISGLDAKEMLFNIIADVRSQRDFQMVQTPQQGMQVISALELEILKIAGKIQAD
ncbi:tyrosine-protein phosphatase [Waddlia chondrophila]|uniref:Putative tyrosine-protein phosphatase n=1 Tax=Waddlia chondrophila (strain ATCC VR-1470 / WSU 86-1044) TaxID=716544 RepID=D6YTM8_WADCW|nr:tyrosine-protein phosphatase [Waddlia chondrophila]ADI37489.1 putative tyrosine-protein phosphatase [Waddlia chondrophila WSU 86-1044]